MYKMSSADIRSSLIQCAYSTVHPTTIRYTLLGIHFSFWKQLCFVCVRGERSLRYREFPRFFTAIPQHYQHILMRDEKAAARSAYTHCAKAAAPSAYTNMSCKSRSTISVHQYVVQMPQHHQRITICMKPDSAKPMGEYLRYRGNSL